MRVRRVGMRFCVFGRVDEVVLLRLVLLFELTVDGSGVRLVLRYRLHFYL